MLFRSVRPFAFLSQPPGPVVDIACAAGLVFGAEDIGFADRAAQSVIGEEPREGGVVHAHGSARGTAAATGAAFARGVVGHAH